METQLLRATLDDLNRDLLERDVPVRLMLLAALAGEHVLLVGPPGTAKSELARRLHGAFVDAPYFERLLTRFSVPEELFGPLSLKALEQDRYERLIDGFLPTAQVAFLDEVFKANSAILNALLTLLNEREFDNGAGRIRVPLVTVVGATNEVPADESLLAFYDRFLLRVPVEPVGDASFGALLALPARAAPAPPRLRAGALEPLRQGADRVLLPAGIAALLVQARAWCAGASVTVSDRRWRKLVALLKVQAASRGASEIGLWDLWLLPYALATQPAQVAALTGWFDDVVVQARALDLQWIGRAVRAFEKQFETESTAQPQDDSGGAGKLALARAISPQGQAAPDSEMLRIVSDRARRRYSRVHVDARVAQVAEMRDSALATCDAARATERAAMAGAATHLWLPPGWRARVAAVHRSNTALAQAMLRDLEQLVQGFASLPLDPSLDAAAPAPITVAAA